MACAYLKSTHDLLKSHVVKMAYLHNLCENLTRLIEMFFRAAFFIKRTQISLELNQETSAQVERGWASLCHYQA